MTVLSIAIKLFGKFLKISIILSCEILIPSLYIIVETFSALVERPSDLIISIILFITTKMEREPVFG